jgi:hypothetical protein
VSAANTSANTAEVPEAPSEGAIDPALLRLIQRVAHREHMLVGVASPTSSAQHPRTTAQKSSTRRRPVIGTARTASVRPTRGTTARKVTWS